MEFIEEFFGLRDPTLNETQICARRRIAQAHGAEFNVGRGGRTSYSLATKDPAQLTAVRDAIKAADLALSDDASRATNW